MKAAILRAFGSPLSIETMPDPVMGTGEIIVDGGTHAHQRKPRF